MLLFPIALSAQFESLKPAPDTQNCGCRKVEAYKYTTKSQTSGEAIVYRNQITFTFGSTLKTFWQTDGLYYVDDKNKIYKLNKVNDLYYFEISNTYYGFKL